ncbi:hypothetical protein [Amaricoccus sp.]|uniref:hypothetical protein n=1 Tax=Amaricoccus sp. TaxID=1872485 RepID=UPI002C878C52|nr:hypothetical protein [Amaricoccus sp.]HMR60638.1 hypothetical protein [Amaricoccus sp.]
MARNGAPELHPDQIAAALNRSAAFRSLPRDQQDELADSMSRVLGFLGSAPARPLAPDLNALRGGGSTGGAMPPGGPMPAPGGTPGMPAPGAAPGAPAGGGQNAFQRAAGATREMLGAIAFPDFTASLIQGTFQAIVDSSIQQMEAYSRLLAETAKTVDQFMEDNITDDMARDHLTSTYGDVFQKDLSSGAPKMTIATDAVGAGELPSFLKNLGFDSPMDLDPQAVEEVVIPETRRTLAEMRHQSLATMVMMGINRIVVSDGEINAKLVFHIDATESMTLTFNDYKPTNWTLAGKLGGNAFGASGLVVNTMNLNAQSDVNMNAELTGEVRVRFRSDYFPLERFADSQAIQLINSHAKVAQPLPEAAAPAAGSPGVAGAVPPPPPPPMEPMPPMPPSGTQQGLPAGRRR